jgi:hypothetical protein
LHRWRRDVWQLRDGQHGQGDSADRRDDDREDAGENRSIDEKVREIHARVISRRGATVSGTGCTVMPPLEQLQPRETTRSPALSPSRTMRLPSKSCPFRACGGRGNCPV